MCNRLHWGTWERRPNMFCTRNLAFIADALAFPLRTTVKTVAKHFASVIVVITLALSCSRAAEPAPAPGSTVKVFLYCYSEPGAGLDFYYSDVFPLELTGRQTQKGFSPDPNSQSQLQDILSAFSAYLKQKGYRFEHISSDYRLDEQEAKAAKHKRAYEGNPCSNCGKVVETGWTYKSSAAAGGEAAASEPSAPSASSAGSSAEGSAARSASAPVQSGSAQTISAAPVAGATLAVRMAEEVDSSKYSPGKQYHGIVMKPADAGNGITIPAGSMAIVTLSNGQSGWVAQLQSLTVKGQPMNVNSGPASIMSSAQSTAASAMNSVSSALSGFGVGKKNKPTAVEAVASGQRVILPPGTQLQFVLSGASPADATASAGNMPGMSNMPGVPHPTGVPRPTPNSGGAATPSSGTTPSATGTLTAKIREALLGPSVPAGRFVVSPDGGHYAVSAMYGSRSLMIVDGVDGPEYDHAPQQYSGGAVDFVFNADGRHSCYVAERGDDLVEVRDNKEAFVITNVKAGSVPTINQSGIHGPGTRVVGHQCVISPSGAHVAVVSGDPRGPSLPSYMFLDGAKSPLYRSLDLGQVAFAGEKLVYAAQTDDQKWHMVVNDKLGPGYDSVASLFLSEDDKHYAFVAQNGAGQLVVLDGVPGTARLRGGNGIQYLTFASTGRLGYIWNKGDRVSGVSQALMVDDQEVSSDTQPIAGINPVGQVGNVEAFVVFSPDGKRFGFAKRVPGGVAAVIDGKAGRAYDGIQLIQFSPDSKHLVFVGNRNLLFPVVDGQEMKGANVIKGFVFAKEGGRYGYEEYGSDGFHMVVDGKESQRYQSVVEDSLTFSPDGKHYAYAAFSNILVVDIVEDGTAAQTGGVAQFRSRGTPGFTFPSMIFSPDSNRLALARQTKDTPMAWFINGQEIVRGPQSWEFPLFSPSSKHFAALSWSGKGFTLFADGRMGPSYEDAIEISPNCARFEAANTFRFLGIKGGQVYRVMVDLGE